MKLKRLTEAPQLKVRGEVSWSYRDDPHVPLWRGKTLKGGHHGSNIFKSVFRYLFPPVATADKLPLLPINCWRDAPAIAGSDERRAVRLLKMYSVVHDDHDALVLLRRHPERSVQELISDYKREHRRKPRLRRAWDRFLALWRK